jgi:ADP-heptose:LPS heptosyltransferase
LGVVWLAGPAEGTLLPYLEALSAAQGQVLVANQPLLRVARVLSGCHLYVGNDSGLTHLAAAVERPEVLALFGPTDPRVWAPLGPKVHVVKAPCLQAPCAAGRAIPCADNHCMRALAPETILALASEYLVNPIRHQRTGTGDPARR